MTDSTSTENIELQAKLEPLDHLKEQSVIDFALEPEEPKKGLRSVEIVERHFNDFVILDYTTSWLLPSWILFIARFIASIFLFHLLIYYVLTRNFFVYIRDMNLFYVEIYFTLTMSLHILKFAYLIYLRCVKLDGMDRVEMQKLQFYQDSHLKPAIIVMNFIIKLIYPFALMNSLFVSLSYWSFVFPYVSKEAISFENMERYAVKPLFMFFELIFSINQLRWWDLLSLTFFDTIYVGICIVLFVFADIWLWNFLEGTTKFGRYVWFAYGGFIGLWFLIFLICCAIQWIRNKINDKMLQKKEDIERIEHEKEELKEIGDVLTYEVMDQ